MKIVRLNLLVVLALLWGVASASAQGWVARYSGGDDCSPVDIKVGSDGSSYVVGARVVGGQVDMLLLKYDTTGNLVWVSSYAGSIGGDDYPAHMALDSNNNIYVTGLSFRGVTGLDIVTLKFDSNGVQQWVRVYNASGNANDQSNGILVDSSGNAYVVGTIFRTSSDLVALKYDTNGTQQWVYIYNSAGDNYDDGYALALDGSNNLVVGGSVERTAGNSDYLTVKIDGATGTPLWAKAYDGSCAGPDYVNDVTVDSSGNIIVVGESCNGTDLDLVVIKYNSSGVSQWAKRYNNGGDEHPQYVVTGADGSIHITGESDDFTTGYDWCTIKYSASGVQQWVKRTRTYGNDYPNALAVDSSYNVYVAGRIQGTTTGDTFGKDGFFVKYDSSGTPTFSARYNGAGDTEDRVIGMQVSGGDAYVAIGSDTPTRRTIVVIKYDLTP